MGIIGVVLVVVLDLGDLRVVSALEVANQVLVLLLSLGVGGGSLCQG